MSFLFKYLNKIIKEWVYSYDYKVAYKIDYDFNHRSLIYIIILIESKDYLSKLNFMLIWLKIKLSSLKF